ncbi:DEAD/DEAH box helicase [Thiococcus pfennigii]|uniref:DEAD/DEAH box helicase n=1 Tax=Thiococcus pfennigii TaxID=1057 RepID=UPI001906D07B|nr:DEAD/DEAH box helicase [Thiococcus pfennigii]MBK1731274.1 ATP-dependent helicase [Thiococcus pfennigii]
MRILHVIWQPAADADAFVQGGAMRLWAEAAPVRRAKAGRGEAVHPFGLSADAWPDLLGTLGLSQPASGRIGRWPVALPSTADGPLPSPELVRSLGDAPPAVESAGLATWQVEGCDLTDPIGQLNAIHYLIDQQDGTLRPGHDLLFWYWFTQSLRRLLLRDQYLPAFVYRTPPKGKGRRRPPPAEVHGGWQWASPDYESLIARAAACLPASAAAGVAGLAHPETLVRHCAEVLLDRAVRGARWPAAFTKRVEGTPLAACLAPEPEPATAPGGAETLYRQWRGWRRRLAGGDHEAPFTLGLRLAEAAPDAPDEWSLRFVAVPKDDPSQRLELATYWARPEAERQALEPWLGADFERALLLNLGLAARIYPRLWDGLETATPHGVALDLDEAFAFLKETAWVLEDAGFKVIVPAWWTPQGRRRIKIRLRTSGSASTSGTATPTKSGLGLEQLVQYRYELAIGDQVVTEEEWRRLVEAKTPLVLFRGQWIELDRDKMQEMLAFWRQQGGETAQMGLPELLQKTATDEDFEIDRGEALAEMLARLRDQRRLEPIADPAGLRATLRDYQRRGVAWLGLLEDLGLNGILADDMGLGKTMQVIARLVQEREAERSAGGGPGPTLLVAPTSVIGNWAKEIRTFAPSLRTLIHHGPGRECDAAAFRARAAEQDIVITSFALVRSDQALLGGCDWHRVVLDEAQNIKNPKAAQTKAIGKLAARHRLALTGTPVENRLMDLWSIFHFVQPGYLDTQARFRKAFELPVQRDADPVRTAMLKRLVEPFILRRVKTDKAIIADLPEKVEARQYCNLSKEQAALYESVVRDVEHQLEAKEGIERQGLMLSTLMRLKQICNHPAQFLQDGSPFSPERSHKLERLDAMLEEVTAAGDSVLIFSQFTEIGAQLEQFLRRTRHYKTYYLHGGTSRARREAMIADFQDPEGEPAVFVLSLKAGGVGITLTKANHVFHFDRWWNPAVEDQASDRAFRIGQRKTVFVHKMVTLGTLEERIDEMIEQKKAVAGAIVGNDESWLAQLDNEHFKALIRLNREAVVD